MEELPDPNEALKRLATCKSPWLIGVRHHSAALARVMPSLLNSIAPKAILLEMPPDFEKWLEFLGREDLEAPVALAACGDDQLLSFYPLADFSPELAAIRWAAQHKVKVIPCDLDLQGMHAADSSEPKPSEPPPEKLWQNEFMRQLLTQTESRDTGELWEKMVETPSINSSPEEVRRAALLFGWAVRQSSGGPTESDARRESAMRDAIDSAPKRSVAIVGSFHGAALLPEPILWAPLGNERKPNAKPMQLSTSLVSYSFAQLDQRSGYPAGVMDPVWQQAMLQASTPTEARSLVSDMAVRLCRHLRNEGHIAGVPDAVEIARIAGDLGRLRGYGVAGRGEILEAIQSALVQGDLMGRGRAVAAAAQSVFIGQRRGRLPAGTPQSGLTPHVQSTLERLKLPTAESIDDEPRELRLDPLRSRLDRARAVVLRRLNLIGIQYAKRFDTEGVGNRENLTEAWRVEWTHATAATVEAAGIRGVTLIQAAEAAIGRMQHAEAGEATADTLHPKTFLQRLAAAAECGLPRIASRLIERIETDFVPTAATSDLVEAASWLQRVAAGHVPGLPIEAHEASPPDVLHLQHGPSVPPRVLVEAAIRQLNGLRGSDESADVETVVELVSIIRGDLGLDDGVATCARVLPLMRSWLTRVRHSGSPRIQGTAWGSLALLGIVDQTRLSQVLSSWFDNASTNSGRKDLRKRLGGALVPLISLVMSDTDWLSGLESRLVSSSDDDFLVRLPALRGAFNSLPAAQRASLLRQRLDTLQPGGAASHATRRFDKPELMAKATAADRAARSAIAALFPDLLLREPDATAANSQAISISEPPGEIPLADRWRLVLGVQGESSSKAKRAAITLDQLYGSSAGECTGSRADLAEAGQGGGTGEPVPSAREWVEEVAGLFGKDVCEEVLGEAAAGGRGAVLEHINVDQVTPSIELLEQVLALSGAMPESELTVLRILARKITDRLAQQLANRLRPALSGLSTPRPTRRKSHRVDLSRTIRENLRSAHRRDDGSVAIAPERMIFRAPAKRQMDWHLIFVVDVSGSMEPSVIYSALMATIFSSLPAIDVKFLAFSMNVIDFSGQVDDPLSLLMEVQVGGGTNIGLGLKAAREAVRNPARTLVVVVSDFEEGVSVPAMLSEVRMLSESGVKLIGLAALDDDAKPRYHAANAAAVASAGMSVAAVSPERLAQWVGDQIRGAAR